MAQAQLNTPSMTLPQAQFLPQAQLTPSMIPISRNASPNGGQFCIFKGCFEIRHSYNTLRDHLFHHTAVKKQMMAHDASYEYCCENRPHFRDEHMRWLHRFKTCVNAPANLRHLISKVWTTTKQYIYNDEHWPEEPELPY